MLQNKVLFRATGLLLLTTAAALANWQSITLSDYTAGTTGTAFAARYRYGNAGPAGAGELYLGVPDLGTSGNRVEGNTALTSGVANSFSFGYNAGQALASFGSINNLAYNKSGVTGIENLFMVVRLNAGQSVNLTGLTLGGNALSDLTITNSTTGGQQYFYALNTGGAFGSPGLAGNLTFNFAGTSTAQERPMVEIQASTVPEPGFYGLLSLGLGGLFVAARRRRKTQAESVQ